MPNYDGLARNAWPGTWSTNGTHPIVLDVEQRGGLRLVSGSGTDTLVNVASGMLQDGMLAYVASVIHADVSTGKYYKYSVLEGESRDSSTDFYQIIQETGVSLQLVVVLLEHTTILQQILACLIAQMWYLWIQVQDQSMCICQPQWDRAVKKS